MHLGQGTMPAAPAGEACISQGQRFWEGDLVCRGGLYFKVELAVREHGHVQLMAIPLTLVGREGIAAVVRVEVPAPRVLLDPKCLQLLRAWYPRGDTIVAF